MSDSSTSTHEVLHRIEVAASCGSYPVEAYEFVLRGLEFTMKQLVELRHVSGRELAEGIQRFALEEFGPMSRHVLNAWGIESTRDFGEIVFHLVEQGVLNKTEDDNIDDFDDCYDFEMVFERDYYRNHPILDH